MRMKAEKIYNRYLYTNDIRVLNLRYVFQSLHSTIDDFPDRGLLHTHDIRYFAH